MDRVRSAQPDHRLDMKMLLLLTQKHECSLVLNSSKLTWMSFPVWSRRTFSAIIRYLPSGPTRGRFELWSPSWRIYGLAWKQKQP